jgi:hypothetical protein
MKVSEEQRRELFDRLRSVLDERTATLLLEVTVPANVELATRGDVQELRAEMLLHFTQLEGRLSGRIDALDDCLSARIGDLGKELTNKLYPRVVPAIGILIALATVLG